MKFESFLNSNWIIKKLDEVPKNPIIIVGLPGIGNVAKISADYIVEKLKLKPFLVIYGKYMPHSVIITKDKLIELPKFYFYKFKNKKNQDIVILTGETQPITEEATYEFAELVLRVFDFNIKEIIALAGKGLVQVPVNPKISIVANNKKYLNSILRKIKKIEKEIVDEKVDVSSIVGLAGIIPGVSEIFNIKASSWMAETFSDPLFLGFNSSYSLLRVLTQYLEFDLDLKEIEEESKKIEMIVKRGEDVIRKLWEEQNKKQKEEKETLKRFYS